MLLLDPNNNEAQKGLQAIASRYLSMALIEKNLGRLHRSLAYIDRGLSISPKKKELQELRFAVVEQQKQQNLALDEPTLMPVPLEREIQSELLICEIDIHSKACWCAIIYIFCN